MIQQSCEASNTVIARTVTENNRGMMIPPAEASDYLEETDGHLKI